MAGSTHILKTILVPLLAAALLYFLLSLLLLPFIRRHRTRYAQYLPLSDMPSFSTSWRTKLSDALYCLFAPSAWRNQPITHHDDSDEFDDEEGEGMVGFEPVETNGGAGGRRAEEERRGLGGIGAGRLSGIGGGGGYDGVQRVGRDLEEGFKDESESEDEDDERRRSLVRGR